MTQMTIKRIGVLSTGWLFAVLWSCLYAIPLCISQFWGKECGVTLVSPFLSIQPAPTLAVVYLLIVVPLLGCVTGIFAALCMNLVLWLSGGVKLNVEIESIGPSDTSDTRSASRGA